MRKARKCKRCKHRFRKVIFGTLTIPFAGRTDQDQQVVGEIAVRYWTCTCGNTNVDSFLLPPVPGNTTDLAPGTCPP